MSEAVALMSSLDLSEQRADKFYIWKLRPSRLIYVRGVYAEPLTCTCITDETITLASTIGKRIRAALLYYAINMLATASPSKELERNSYFQSPQISSNFGDHPYKQFLALTISSPLAWVLSSVNVFTSNL